MAKPATDKVPQGMQARFDEIAHLTDAFSAQYLNEEYAEMARKLIAALCRKRPSPVVSGQAKTWACGVIHALGMFNFLFDSSQKPHVKTSELYDYFGVASSTGQGKSKTIRDIMKMSHFDATWSLPSRLDSHPAAWLISVNGFILDARTVPREIQEEALRKGLIPYLPEERD